MITIVGVRSLRGEGIDGSGRGDRISQLRIDPIVTAPKVRKIVG